MQEKNIQIKKLTSQMQTLLKVLDESTHKQKRDKDKMEEQLSCIQMYKKLYKDMKDTVQMVKEELGIDPF